jgi:hypothetical protein
VNKIKIVRIAPIHKSPLKYLLKKYPDLPDLPYKEQMSIHSMEGVSYGSGFSTAMNELDYDAHELVYDFEPMQKRWAIENSIKFNSDSYEYEILLAQLRKVQPDVVLFQGNAYMIPDKELHQLKKKIPSIKLLLLHLAYPVAPHKISCMDHIFAGYPELYEYYQKKGLPVSLLYHGFDHHVLEKIQFTNKSIPISFCGSSGYGFYDHNVRYWTLYRLLQSTNLHLYVREIEYPSSGLKIPYKKLNVSNQPSNGKFKEKITLKKVARFSSRYIRQEIMKRVEGIKKGLLSFELQYIGSELIEDSSAFDILYKSIRPKNKLLTLFPDKCQGEVHGLDFYKILGSSFATFHIGTDPVVYQNAGAMRIFESAGVGTALFIEQTQNIQDLLIPEKEIIVYNSTRDCIKKIKYYLEDPDELVRIGINAQKRVLSDHTILKRCRDIDSKIKELL